MRQRDFHSRSPLKRKRKKGGRTVARYSRVGGDTSFYLGDDGRDGAEGGIIGNGSEFGSVGRETERGLRIIWNIRRISPI